MKAEVPVTEIRVITQLYDLLVLLTMHLREVVGIALLSLVLAAHARPLTTSSNVNTLSMWCGARAFLSDDCTSGEILEGGSMFGLFKDICVGGDAPARSLRIDAGGRFCRYKAFYLNGCRQGPVGKGSACLCLERERERERLILKKPLTRRPSSLFSHSSNMLIYAVFVAVGEWNHLDADKCISVAAGSGNDFRSLGIYW